MRNPQAVEAAKRRYYLTHKREINERNMRNYYRDKGAYRRRQRKYEQKVNELARTDKMWHAKKLIKLARHRAKSRNVPFSLTYRDIIIPEICPVLGIPLVHNKQKLCDGSATLDRIRPDIGYVVGNVIVVSIKANRIKNDATLDDLRKVLSFYERTIGC